MKKILAVLVAVLCAASAVEAKDYAKMHMNEMKKMQKYSATKNYFDKTTVHEKNNEKLDLKDPKLIKLGVYEDILESKYKEKPLLTGR